MTSSFCTWLLVSSLITGQPSVLTLLWQSHAHLHHQFTQFPPSAATSLCSANPCKGTTQTESITSLVDFSATYIYIFKYLNICENKKNSIICVRLYEKSLECLSLPANSLRIGPIHPHIPRAHTEESQMLAVSGPFTSRAHSDTLRMCGADLFKKLWCIFPEWFLPLLFCNFPW